MEFGEGTRRVLGDSELASRLKIFDVMVKYTRRDVQEQNACKGKGRNLNFVGAEALACQLGAVKLGDPE